MMSMASPSSGVEAQWCLLQPLHLLEDNRNAVFTLSVSTTMLRDLDELSWKNDVPLLHHRVTATSDLCLGLTSVALHYSLKDGDVRSILEAWVLR